jgi:4-alpha-glucanotransferase
MDSRVDESAQVQSIRMSDESLHELASLRGLGEAYYDHRGELRRFAPAARRAILQAMGVNVADETSVRTAIESARAADTASTAGASVCYQPPVFDAHKCWGISVQLYTLRSARNWGIGDFRDLRELIELAAPLGCDVIGLNPLHALFTADAAHCSPYSPSSRLFLNPLYIAVEEVAEFSDSAPLQALYSQASFQTALAALRAADKVMYEQVASLKLLALRLLYRQFVETHLQHDTPRAREFVEFAHRRGKALRLHALFEALDEYFHTQSPPLANWREWPDAYRDPQSMACAEFALENRDSIELHLYLQWIADSQLADVQRDARERGMRIGLYGDLAVGANPNGSEVWSNQSLYVMGAAVGAPPDPLALNGQDWGIPPMEPSALRSQQCQPFAALLHANMQHCGALRIDHVMSLFRLWWVPQGFSAIDGVYVHYPLDALVEHVAHISDATRCLVIGEDLGTVPDEIRHAMATRNLYHYKVLFFEKDGNGFRLPEHYERRAVATATTHDLPPLQAWWQGDDLQLRDALQLYPSADTAALLHREREQDRFALLRALRDRNLWQWQEGDPLPPFSFALARAIHLYLGISNAALVLVQLEDLIGMTDPVNVPGTHTAHANWQRKLTQPCADILRRNEVVESLQALTQARRPPGT